MTEGTHLYGDRAPHNLQYVVLVASANLTQERVLTGTANQITITDNGAGSTVVLSIPSALTIPGTLDSSFTNTVAAGDSLIDVHIIQGDDDALTGTLRGAYITASNGDEVATGTIRGAEIKARAGYPGETGANVNVLEGFSISSDAKTYDVTTHRGGEIILDGGAGTSTLAVGLRIANNFQANRATTSYGLQIYRDSFDYTADVQLSSGGLIGGTSGHITIGASGNVVINEAGADLDTRIESSGNANMLFVDGGNDRIGIGTASPVGTFHIKAGASGATAHTSGDDLVFEHSTHCGVSFLVPDDKQTVMYFGFPSDNDYAYIAVATYGGAMSFSAGGGTMDLYPTYLRVRKPVKIRESDAAVAAAGGYGQLWMKNDTPNILMFSDDAGTDFTVDVTPV